MRNAPNRHLDLLHGNFLRLMHGAERAEFGRAMAKDTREVTDGEIVRLLANPWRAQLTGAWLAGFDRREQHRDRIGELLLASATNFAGQGFCFALARFGTPADAELLAAYLDRYLPRVDLRYDQDWAIGALLHVDARLVQPFLDTGTWQRWAARHGTETPEQRHAFVDELCTFADESRRGQSQPRS